MHADQLPWIRRYGRTLAISVAVVALTMPAASSQANASVAPAARRDSDSVRERDSDSVREP